MSRKGIDMEDEARYASYVYVRLSQIFLGFGQYFIGNGGPK